MLSVNIEHPFRASFLRIYWKKENDIIENYIYTEARVWWVGVYDYIFFAV